LGTWHFVAGGGPLRKLPMATIRTRPGNNRSDYRRSMSGGDMLRWKFYLWKSSSVNIQDRPGSLNPMIDGMFQIRLLNFASRRVNIIKKILWWNELLSCKCIIHMIHNKTFEGTNSELYSESFKVVSTFPRPLRNFVAINGTFTIFGLHRRDPDTTFTRDTLTIIHSCLSN
jgi:hypothetical protein